MESNFKSITILNQKKGYNKWYDYIEKTVIIKDNIKIELTKDEVLEVLTSLPISLSLLKNIFND